MSQQTDAAKLAFDLKVGEVLLVIAVAVQEDLKVNLSKTSPVPSKPGQYPRWVTGNLRESVVYEPTGKLEAGREGQVRTGYTEAGYYGAILETVRRRLGLRHTVEKLRSRINALTARIPKL